MKSLRVAFIVVLCLAWTCTILARGTVLRRARSTAPNNADTVESRTSAPASYVLTFPQTVNGNLGSYKYQTNIFLLNNSSSTAKGMIYLYKQDGTPMEVATNQGTASSFEFTLTSGATYHLETDGLGDAVIGWVEVLSDIPLSGSGSFVVLDGKEQFLTEVGVGDASRGRSVMIFVDNAGAKATAYAICNPSGTAAASVTLELRRLDGSIIATKPARLVGPRNQKAEFVSQVFSESATGSFQGILVFNSLDNDIAVTTLRSRGEKLTSMPAASAVANTNTAGNLLFSRLADGLFGSLRYQTSFILMNNSTKAASATIDLTSATGSAMNLTIGGNRRSSFTVTVPGGGALELITDGNSSPGATGWASLRSDVELSGCALFTSKDAASGAFVEQVGVPASPKTSKVVIYGQVSNGVDTAFALTNPGETTQSVRFRLVKLSAGGSGYVLAERTMSLGAKNHTAEFLSGYFDEVYEILMARFEGWLEIEGEAGKEVTALTLRTRGASMTSLPVAGYVATKDNYGVQPVVTGTATTESSGTKTLTASTSSVSLSDKTKLNFASMKGSTTATLSLERTTNDLTISESVMTPSGSKRILKVDSIKHDTAANFDWGEFAPIVTIPAKEIGNINIDTTSVARFSRDPETNAQQVHYLPATRDASGDLVFCDPWLPDDLYDGSRTGAPDSEPSSPVRAPAPKTIEYVPASFQGGLNWTRAPMLVRMVPDASDNARRVPLENLSAEEREREKKKPVQNVIVLIHGHNELEKAGSYDKNVDRPWYFDYKRDVWTYLYDTFLQDHGETRKSCTVFYEFIYPTWRPVFDHLDAALSVALAQELAPQIKTGQKFNLFLVSHSMGGVVMRAGLVRLSDSVLKNLQRAISWGSPHHGTPLNSFRIAVSSPAHGSNLPWFVRGKLREELDSLVMLTPSIHDLAWSTPTGSMTWGLRLNEYFTGGNGDAKNDLTYGTNLYSKNIASLNSTDTLGSKYSFLYGITSKGLSNFKGDTISSWRTDFKGISSDIGKGATIVRWIVQNSTSMLDGAKIGDSDGVAPVLSMAGKNLRGTAVNLGDVDHEQYFGSPKSPGSFTDETSARLTARQTFTSANLKDASCNCPELVVTEPVKGKNYTGDEKVPVKGTLVWPGDTKPYSRMKDMKATDSSESMTVSLSNFKAEYPDKFSGEFTANALGTGGILKSGLTLIALLTDGTELRAEVVLGETKVFSFTESVTFWDGWWEASQSEVKWNTRFSGSITGPRNMIVKWESGHALSHRYISARLTNVTGSPKLLFKGTLIAIPSLKSGKTKKILGGLEGQGYVLWRYSRPYVEVNSSEKHDSVVSGNEFSISVPGPRYGSSGAILSWWTETQTYDIDKNGNAVLRGTDKYGQSKLSAGFAVYFQ